MLVLFKRLVFYPLVNKGQTFSFSRILRRNRSPLAEQISPQKLSKSNTAKNIVEQQRSNSSQQPVNQEEKLIQQMLLPNGYPKHEQDIKEEEILFEEAVFTRTKLSDSVFRKQAIDQFYSMLANKQK